LFVLERIDCRYKLTFAATISRKWLDIRGLAISLNHWGAQRPEIFRLTFACPVVCALPVLRVTGASEVN
jgi:hypothetical protein